MRKEETFKKLNIKTPEIVNNNEFRIVGMSRSGNHSIINWIIHQLEGRFCFLNCAEPKTNPFYTARPLNQEQTYRVNFQGFDLESEKRGSFSRKNYLIHSYEDCFLGSLNHKSFEEQHDSFVGISKHRLDILIIRDPFNLFASRKRSNILEKQKELGCKPATPLMSTRIWKQHAREAAGKKSFLRKNRIVINYNLWASNQEYRKKIASDLGINFTDAGFHKVSDVAGGSSFDGLVYANSADQMKVLERWKYYIHDQEYKKIMDDEVVRLSKKIFPQITALESISV